MRNLLLAATAALCFAVPAAATPSATYNFTLTGPSNFNWTLPASPTPDSLSSNSFRIEGVDVNGASSRLTFYTASSSGGFNLRRNSITTGYGGPVVFTGPLSAPTFTLGTFGLTDGVDNYDLTISAAVPEPASWAMLIAGFGLTGAAMRRRRTSAVAA